MRELIGKMLAIMGKKDSNKMLWDRWKRTPDAKIFTCLALRITLTLLLVVATGFEILCLKNEMY